MRVKISVTIDEKVLQVIDRVKSPGRCRSRILEDAAREHLAEQSKPAPHDTRDREILDRVADDLNREMRDVLSCLPIP